jgi:hypothetical protein
LSGNVTGGNIRTGGLISATGSITGNYIFGNGSQLTNLITNTIQNGNSNVLVGSSGGNVSINVNGISPILIVTPVGMQLTGNLSATLSITGGNILTGGIVSATGEITGANVKTNGFVSATGNVTGGNILFGSGNVSGSGNVTGGNILTGGSISAAGNILTGGSISAAGNISGAGNVNITGSLNTGNIFPLANATSNIGTATFSYNTIFAKATSAQYADLAEMYCADSDYTPGTVLDLGGTEEVTITTQSHSTQVVGIVSTNPSYLMNSTLTCVNAVQVALVGRVPCSVVGTIRKGDRLVSSDRPGVAQALNTNLYQPGCIVGKALEEYNSTEPGVIEVAVGRS